MKEQHSNLVFIFTAWTGMVLMSALQAEAPEANPRGLRQGPVVQEITPIGTPTKDRNPKYTFHSDQAGTTLTLPPKTGPS